MRMKALRGGGDYIVDGLLVRWEICVFFLFFLFFGKDDKVW